jgi:hypothetical protein
MLRATHSEPSMLLPEGMTCGRCRHFRRCSQIYGHIAEDEVCDWAPSRFIDAGPPPAEVITDPIAIEAAFAADQEAEDAAALRGDAAC